MKVVTRRAFLFKVKQVYFSPYPYDVDGCDVVKFIYCRNKVSAPGFNCREALTSVIDLTRDLEDIWKSMDRKSCRYSIRRAIRDGVVVDVNTNYEDFYKIYTSFRRQKGLDCGLIRFFGLGSLSFNELKEYGTLFIAKYDNDILCGHVYLVNDSNILFWQAARKLNVDAEIQRLIGNASRLIHWEAIKYAKKIGIKEFDMGGLFSEEDVRRDPSKKNINFFKLSFGGQVIKVYNYKKIYSKLYKLASLSYRLVGGV